MNLQVENLRFRVAEEGTPCWDPSQQVCPRVALPGCQGVVGHIGKVQKWEEVLGANHAKALGEVGVHPVEERKACWGPPMRPSSQLRPTPGEKGIDSTPHLTPQWFLPRPSSPSHSKLGGAGPGLYGDQIPASHFTKIATWRLLGPSLPISPLLTGAACPGMQWRRGTRT